MDELNSNRFVMGDHHLSLMITDADTNRLIDSVSRARAALADPGMVAAEVREQVLDAGFHQGFEDCRACRVHAGYCKARAFQ